MTETSLTANSSRTDYAPIALFVYNRLDHSMRTLEALRNNDLAAESDLIAFSDGAKNTAALQGVTDVRNYLKTVKGFKSVTLVERDENLGLANSIIDGVTFLCERHGRVIVLEDDLITSRYFLRYMNDALLKYAEDQRVISIHGYIYPVRETLPPTFFLRGADCWGWATWKRGWDLFEQDAGKLYAAIQAGGDAKAFDFDGQYGYTNMLKLQIEGRINSWAIRWYASAFLANRLTLYPGVSLVQNIGNDSSGTHCGDTDVFVGRLANEPIPIENIPVSPDKKAYAAISRYFNSLNLSFMQRIKNKMTGLLDGK